MLSEKQKPPDLPIFCKWVVLATTAAVVGGAYVSAHDPVGKVTWDREIAPIVQARCVSCHAPGGQAPMALTTYEEVRPWARAIREEVLARRMPKWHIVRGYGDFANDRSLSPFEIALMTAWVDGGAPRSLPNTSPRTATAPPPRLPAPFVPPSKTRTATIPCTAERLPAGHVLGFTPMLAHGGSLRIDVARAGFEEPLFWLRDFDVDAAETYWLRTPIDSSETSGIEMTFTGSDCRVTVILAARTGKS